jgi:hypothetical protein
MAFMEITGSVAVSEKAATSGLRKNVGSSINASFLKFML